MHKNQIASKVAEKLFAAENAVDDAMVSATQLLEGLVEARRELNLSAMAGEVATARTAESIAALAEARRAVLAAHSALSNLQRKLEIEDSVIGALGKPTEGEEPTGFAANLRLAASQ